MRLLLMGLVVFLVPGTWALIRARRELDQDGGVSGLTFVAVFIAYVGHAAATCLAAWKGTWPMPIHRSIASLGGGLLVLVGAGIYLAARLQFKSFRLTWGLEMSRLVTNGIYRVSRNPQTLGVLLMLSGVGLLGRSGVGLLLVGVAWMASMIWLRIEEGILERRFGELYVEYRSRVPRFLHVPGRRRHRDRNMAA